MGQLTWRNGLGEAETAEVRELLAKAEAADGVAPVGEHVIMRLRQRRGLVDQIEPVQADVRSEHFVVRDSAGNLAGYAHLDVAGEQEADPFVAELAVHPEHRGKGVGARLVEALLDRAELTIDDDGDSGRLRIWSHGEHPAARRLAERYRFVRSRELWRMGRDLGEADAGLPAPQLPRGVQIRPFRVGADEAAVVRVNRRAFAWHPEQGGMTEDDLRERQREDWFDPAGFLLAVDPADRLLGFHWTKVHPPRMGEVYVIGVDPDTQGTGLGKLLVAAGLRHLRDVGCSQVMLYVEADNGPAINVYRRLGFQHWDSDVQFGR